jgi:CheY-like chemotaxis protein
MIDEQVRVVIGAARRRTGILIVDDMVPLLTLLKFELEPRGFAVWLSVDGDDAIDLYRENRSEIDLVLLDVQMAGLDGPRTLTALQRLDPDVLACFMTGNSGDYTEKDLLDRGAACVFMKPFRTADMAQRLQQVLESAHHGRDGVRKCDINSGVPLAQSGPLDLTLV